MDSRIDEMVSNPHQHFNAPRDVLRDDDLSFDDKKRILESWKLDAMRLAESTAENMSGGEESDLREVSKTLVELKAMEQAPQVARPKRRRAGMALSVTVGAVVGAGVGLVLLSVATGAPILTLVETTLVGALLGGLVRVFRKAVHV